MFLELQILSKSDLELNPPTISFWMASLVNRVSTSQIKAAAVPCCLEVFKSYLPYLQMETSVLCFSNI